MASASRIYWGPRLWRVFHLMANISDRRDISSLWKHFIGLSAAALPCALCRIHFMEYLRSHKIVLNGDPLTLRGIEFRNTLKTQLRLFHNAVNARLSKPNVTAEEYDALYPNKTRLEILFEIQTLINEIKAAWEPLLHSSINPSIYSKWKVVYAGLFNRLMSGSQL